MLVLDELLDIPNYAFRLPDFLAAICSWLIINDCSFGDSEEAEICFTRCFSCWLISYEMIVRFDSTCRIRVLSPVHQVLEPCDVWHLYATYVASVINL